jgi:indole-3-glycerol phosphate synthase
MSVLERIFAEKRVEVAEARAKVSEAALLAEARSRGLPLGFLRALRESAHPTALIAEVKRASPSQGMIRADFDPVRVALDYQEAGADCLSVLTDRPNFQGAPEYLRSVREAVSLPLLRKDFLYDPYQVLEARAWGADAVLVILAGVSRAQAEELIDAAGSLGMDVLVEVHDEAEMEAANELQAALIGINNRDLSTFRTDLGTTDRLAPLAASSATLVSESALANFDDVQRVARAGARAVLIGTTFCGSPDVQAAVREVMGW